MPRLTSLRAMALLGLAISGVSLFPPPAGADSPSFSYSTRILRVADSGPTKGPIIAYGLGIHPLADRYLAPAVELGGLFSYTLGDVHHVGRIAAGLAPGSPTFWKGRARLVAPVWWGWQGEGSSAAAFAGRWVGTGQFWQLEPALELRSSRNWRFLLGWSMSFSQSIENDQVLNGPLVRVELCGL